MRVLFVCEANRSRSPVAAALWTRELARRSIPASVSSAGTHALPDEPASNQTMWTAARHGLDLAAHRSRPLDDVTVDGAHLILTMTREQADHVGMHHRRVSERMFLVGELAALLRLDEHTEPLAATAPLPAPTGTGVISATRLDAMLAAAHTRRLMRGIQDDDITEPGEDPTAVETTITRLTTDITTITEHLTG